MITSLENKDNKITPTLLAKETVRLYGESVLPSLSQFYQSHNIVLTAREYLLVRDQVILVINRVRKICGAEPLNVELTKTMYPAATEE